MDTLQGALGRAEESRLQGVQCRAEHDTQAGPCARAVRSGGIGQGAGECAPTHSCAVAEAGQGCAPPRAGGQRCTGRAVRQGRVVRLQGARQSAGQGALAAQVQQGGAQGVARGQGAQPQGEGVFATQGRGAGSASGIPYRGAGALGRGGSLSARSGQAGAPTRWAPLSARGERAGMSAEAFPGSFSCLT